MRFVRTVPIRQKFVLYALIVGLIFWLADSLLDYWIYYEESALTFLQLLLTEAPEHELYIRSLLLTTLLASGYMIGVREEHKAELFDRLKDRERQFRELYDLSPVALVAIDEAMLISDLNTAALKFFNKPREELIGERFGQAVNCVNAQDQLCGQSSVCKQCLLRSTVAATFRENKAQQSLSPAQLRVIDYVTGQQSDLFLKLSSSILHEGGKRFVLLGLTDITEQVQLAEKLERTARVKDEFLSVISHELRTPLNPILGFAELLESEASEENMEMVSQIKESAEEELRIVNELISYTELVSSIREPEYEQFNLLHSLKEFYRSYLKSKEKEGVDFEFINGHEGCSPIPQDLDAWLDMKMLEDVVEHLLSNGRNFTDKGHVQMLVGYAVKDAPGRISTLCFSVRDTGIGMYPEQVEQLSQPFTQADSSATRAVNGLGLGLSIVQAIISLLGGTLTITSEPGTGSTFMVRVPVKLVR